MKSVEERLNSIFSDRSFLEAHKEADNFESVYAAVKERDSEITRDELQSYLRVVSDYMHSDELSDEALEEVAGGFAVLAIAAGIAEVCGAIGGCTAIGYGIGRFIYHCRQ